MLGVVILGKRISERPHDAGASLAKYSSISLAPFGRDANYFHTSNHNHSYHKLVCRDDRNVKWYNDTDGKKRLPRCLSSTSEAFESESVLKLAIDHKTVIGKDDDPP